MLRIVCVQSDNYQGRGAQYVNILHDSVRRNLKEGTEGEFICFTDDPRGLDRGIVPRPLPRGLNGWWNKLWLFSPGLFPVGDRILFFDLDTVITGRLDEITAYDGPFAILRDWLEPQIINSSVMAWPSGWGHGMWQGFENHGRPDYLGGDQEWIRRCLEPDWLIPGYNTLGGPLVRLQDVFPDLFVSFKMSGGKIPDKASVCCFHGIPRPHEMTTGWVPEVWRIGGLVRAELDKICNTNRQKLLDNVSAACKRNLPWLDLKPAHDGHAVIVGGGPSLDDMLEQIRWRKSLGQTIWALNGSAAWLQARGIRPDFHVIVDARKDNARFVEHADPFTHHFIASQCDPAIFDKLLGCKTTLWHSPADGVAELLEKDTTDRPVHLIGGGSTVGLCAIVLAFGLGYRKIHLYGYDSSYRNDTHHAYMQNLNDGDLVVDVLAGNRKFKAAPWMVQQAEEFCSLAVQLADDGAVITVAGDGLLPCLARELEQREPNAVDIRAHEILSRLPDGDVTGVEVGVYTGALSMRLLARRNLELFMVDSWAGEGRDYLGDSGDFHARLSQAKQDEAQRTAERAVEPFGKRAIVLSMSSQDAATLFEQGSLDFVFIDADHSYEGCKRDIELWSPKLKPGGLLSGHDYGNTDFENFGVTRAVDEYAAQCGLTLTLGGNFCWFIQTRKSDAGSARDIAA